VNGRVNNGEGPVNSGGVLVNSGGGLVNSGSCLINSGSCPIINRFRVPVIEECQYDELSHSEDTISILSDGILIIIRVLIINEANRKSFFNS
jgi:hypothetical protein